jgi:hypothetical protein
LIRCASVTHQFDCDQRYVGLDFQVASATTLTVHWPPAKGGATMGDYIAPPGWYMLFLVRKPAGPNNRKMPSIARFVQIQ